jgi:NitT/TauT family transport system permease protein/sulfonate transport system permease protein
MRSVLSSKNFGQRAIAELLTLLALAAWWWSSTHGATAVLPSPPAVFHRLLDIAVNPSLSWHVLITTGRVLVSVVLALALGFLLALLTRAVPWLSGVIMNRILVALNGMPSVGWAILAVIWFKVSDLTVIFVQVMILLPFSLINFAEGLKNLDREVIEMAESFARRRAGVVRKVVMPMLLPYGVAALRVSYGVCWKIALISELFGARSGLGYLMLQAQAVGDITSVLATCMTIVMLFALGEGLLINPITRSVRRDLAANEP